MQEVPQGILLGGRGVRGDGDDERKGGRYKERTGTYFHKETKCLGCDAEPRWHLAGDHSPEQPEVAGLPTNQLVAAAL